ncbi:MAG: nitrous oxide reductase accessory protein NosL [Rubrivivax sp.]
MNRRHLLGIALTPLAAALLTACGRSDDGTWAEGMAPIVWDRDTCARCGMAIGDRRYAAQLRGGPKDEVFKFDDIGCAVTWCTEKVAARPWINDPATRLWVAEFAGQGRRWLPARQAHYVVGPNSPMGYNQAAYPTPQPGSLAFEDMAEQTAAAWPANCRPDRNAPRTT